MSKPIPYLTSAAAKFCSENGRPTSPRTLQKYRRKAPDDPGEKGPNWFRDPVTGFAIYFEADLLAWIRERDERLVERAPITQPPQLRSQAA